MPAGLRFSIPAAANILRQRERRPRQLDPLTLQLRRRGRKRRFPRAASVPNSRSATPITPPARLRSRWLPIQSLWMSFSFLTSCFGTFFSANGGTGNARSYLSWSDRYTIATEHYLPLPFASCSTQPQNSARELPPRSLPPVFVDRKPFARIRPPSGS